VWLDGPLKSMPTPIATMVGVLAAGISFLALLALRQFFGASPANRGTLM